MSLEASGQVEKRDYMDTRNRVLQKLVDELGLELRPHSYLFKDEEDVLCTSEGIEMAHRLEDEMLIIQIAVPITSDDPHNLKIQPAIQHAKDVYHMRKTVMIDLTDETIAELRAFMTVSAVLSISEDKIAKAKWGALEDVRYISRQELEVALMDRIVSRAVNGSAVIGLVVGFISEAIVYALNRDMQIDIGMINHIAQFTAFGLFSGLFWGYKHSNIMLQRNNHNNRL